MVWTAATAVAQEPHLGPAPLGPTGFVQALPPLGEGVSAPGGNWYDISTRANSVGYFNTYQTLNGVPLNWNGNVGSCNPGTTAQAYKNEVAQQVNWFRAMAGVPAGITFDPGNSAKDQDMALMISANNQLSHAPPTSWTCYTADGATAAGQSNICYGYDLLAAPGCIMGYMSDTGSGNTEVGHRRWILYPQSQVLGTGDVPATGVDPSGQALWAWDSNVFGPRPATRDPYVAWPPRGYVPYQMVYGRWSFAYPSADFSQAHVSMTVNGPAVSLTIDPVANGYGENTIVWEPVATFLGGQPDATVTISITNVQGSGIPTSFNYQVTVFDPSLGSYPPYFDGQASLGGGVYYLQFPNNNIFGYYNFPSSSILYHYDMGFEAFIPGSGSGLYLYDFTTGHWWYTGATLFPYLYDFNLGLWIYYFPNTKSAGHYTTGPRYFGNLINGTIFTM